MALKKTIKLNSGIEVKDSYIRVETVTIAEKQTASVVVNYYFDKTKSSVKQTSHLCAYAIDGVNPIKQAYDYLKTLPEFDGAQDC